ncbi:MAG: FAD-dependent thymidylate synthase [Oscillospiraceae bacterium]|nr:FAD-dependent thymidylate synthase [Oscillospiraceae bacterium]
MNHASAKIIASSSAGDTVVASAARISTTQGTALEIYARSCEKENNGTLIEKVVASGHTSTLEHQFFTVAFDNVSVCTEEFVIEFRLGSYTVKSRRYVDFTNAGFYVPPMPDALLPEYQAHMQSLFDAYAELLEMEIPKEDARYLLPYCFRSNFYCTMNARELLYMVTVMCRGRGSYYPELKTLGESLKAQLRDYFPHLPELFENRFHADESEFYARYAPVQPDGWTIEPKPAAAEVELRSAPPESAHDLLMDAQIYNGMFSHDPEGPYEYSDLIASERNRELELLHAQFEIRNLSLAAITHLVRHRMQTVLVPQVTQAVYFQNYVLPESVRENAKACEIYQQAFARNAAAFKQMRSKGLPDEAAQYFALAGNQLDVLCDMNGRELLHFMKLRTCTRAQWEIRACAVELLRQLRKACPAVFGCFGPSCYVSGKCPEGRLSCGKAEEMRARFSEGGTL